MPSPADLLPLLAGEFSNIAGATQPFLTGPVGQSPVLQQAVEQFKALTQPVIQNQFALQGLSRSPALGQALGVSLGNALVPLISQDMQNRLAAIGLAQQRVGSAGQLGLASSELGQLGPLRAAQTAAIPAQLGLTERDVALRERLDPQRLALEQELGRGQLGLGGRAQTLREQLDPRALALQEELGRGQLGISGRAQTLQEQLQPRALSLQEELGRGQLGLAERGTALREQLDPRTLALQEELGRAQAALGGRAQTLQEQVQPGALALAQETQRGQLGLQQQELGQFGPLRSAQAFTTASQPGLQALGLAGQFAQASGNQLSDLSNQLRQRQELGLGAFGSAGEAQRNVQQQAFDAAQQDFLRRQALSEASSTGLFGGSVLPPTITQSSRTRTSSSK